MKNKVFLVMLLSIAALSAGCNTVAGAGKDIQRGGEKIGTPRRSRLPRQRPFRRRRAASGCPGMPDAALSPVGSRTVRRLDGRSGRRMSCPAGHECGAGIIAGIRKSETGTMMRKSVWMVGAMLAASLGGCASTGVYEAETALHETFIVDTNSQAAFRRAGRTCAPAVNVAHPYNVAYAWKLGERARARRGAGLQGGRTGQGAGTDHVRSRKPEQGQGDDHRGRRGRWDKAEIAAARASIESATPACQGG